MQTTGSISSKTQTTYTNNPAVVRPTIIEQSFLIDTNFNNLIINEIISSVISLFNENTLSYNPTNQLLNYYKLSQETKQNVISKLQAIGNSTGTKLSLNFNKNSNMSQLMVMKYVCKEVYHNICGRQMDALKTNHQGIYYLLDKQLLANSTIHFDKSLQYYNANENEEQSECLQLYPIFIASVIQGFLDKEVTFSIENGIITYKIKY